MLRGYYFITDSQLSRAGNLNDVKSALSARVCAVQYREKNLSTRKMYQEARKIKKICQRKTLFIINDRVDLALAVDADGVHLGQDDLPYSVARKILGKKKIIGVTVHNLEEALEAEKIGADYLGLSPIFATATKKDAGPPAGIKLIKKIKKSVSLPIIAIGGLTLKNAPDVVKSGADCVCAVSAVVTKKDVASRIKKFQDLFKGGNKSG